MKEKQCSECGKIFYSKAHNAKYCSKECKDNGSKNNHKLICKCCGKSFTSNKSSIQFCSLSCSSKFNAHSRPATIKKCKYCNEDFKAYKKKMIFCSKKCRGKFDSEKNRIYVICEYCGEHLKKTKFQFERSNMHYCSSKCRSKHQSYTLLGENNPNFKDKTIIVKCSNCNKKFSTQECYLKNSDGIIKKNIYCSIECKGEHQRTILQGENNPKYRSIKCNCTYCNKDLLKTPNFIKSRNNVYCSQECWHNWLSENNTGENNPNYDSSISIEDRILGRNFKGYAYWRRQVYIRDRYTCQCCKCEKGGNLVAHHIFSYANFKELRTDIDNGITLCKTCHKLFHDTYGYGNNDEKQFKKFLEKYKN